MFVKMPRESKHVWESSTEIVTQAHAQMRLALDKLSGQVGVLQGRIR